MNRERAEQLWLVLILAIIAFPTLLLFLLSAFPDLRGHAARVGLRGLADVAAWFDPMFFQYNLLLLFGAKAVVPTITFMYVVRMRREKLRRLAPRESRAALYLAGLSLPPLVVAAFVYCWLRARDLWRPAT